MGFLANPFVLKGAAMGLGALFGKFRQNAAQKRSPEESAAIGGAQGAAGQLGQAGTSLMQQGAPLTQQAGNYWSTLLGGNRAQMAQATAAPRAAITDTYRGAESNLERSGVRGAQRDVAQAELGRQRAGQIAGLTTGIQPFAAQQLGAMGSDLTGKGGQLASSAGTIWNSLLGEGYKNRVYARDEGAEASAGIGPILFDILNASFGKKPFDVKTAKVPTGKVDDIPGRLGSGIRDPRTSSEMWQEFLSGSQQRRPYMY